MRENLTGGVKKISHPRFVVVALALASCAAQAFAQKPPASAVDELTRTRAALVESAEEVKKNTRELIALREKQLSAAEQKHEQLRQLFAEGLVSRRQVEDSEHALAETRAGLEVLRRQ